MSTPNTFGRSLVAVVQTCGCALAAPAANVIAAASNRPNRARMPIRLPSRHRAGLADRCEVQIAYAIGVAEPVSVMIDTFGTCKISEDEIERRVKKSFDMRPAGIINMLDLKKPVYRKTAAYGHFGREEPGFTWEITDKVSSLSE